MMNCGWSGTRDEVSIDELAGLESGTRDEVSIDEELWLVWDLEYEMRYAKWCLGSEIRDGASMDKKPWLGSGT